MHKMFLFNYNGYIALKFEIYIALKRLNNEY